MIPCYSLPRKGDSFNLQLKHLGREGPSHLARFSSLLEFSRVPLMQQAAQSPPEGSSDDEYTNSHNG